MTKSARIVCIRMFAIAVGTLLVRLVALYIFGGEQGYVASYPDEVNYYLPAARMIGESITGFFTSPRSLWNGPLNPLWLALLGGNVPLAKFCNVLIFSLASAALSCAVGVRFGWFKGVAVAVGLLLYPPSYEFVPTVLTEPPYVSLLMVSCAVLVWRDFSMKGFVTSGLLLGLATLVRPTTQMFGPLLVVVGMLLWKSIWGKRLVVHGLCAFAICLPTMVWNFSQFGKVGIANGIGPLLYLGGDLRRDGDEPVYSGVDFDTFRITTPYAHFDTEGDARLAAVAKDRMRRHPLATGTLFIRKGFRYLLGSFHGYFWPYNGLVGKIRHDPSWSSKFSTLVWLSLQVFVACGAFFSLFRRDLSVPVRLYVACIIGYFTALHIVTFPIPRMAFPLFPYMLVLAVLGVCPGGGGRKARIGVAVCCPLVFGFVAAPRDLRFPTESSVRELAFYNASISGAFEGLHDIDGEAASLRVVGVDPYMIFRFEGMPLLRSQVATFKLGARCPKGETRQGTAQLFWSVEGTPFAEARSASFPIRSIDSVHIVRPALSALWRGKLTGLRIDLPPELRDCEVSLSDVKVLD